MTRGSVVVASFALLGVALTGLAKGYERIPHGALANGFTKCIIDERPKLSDVCLKQEGVAKWYNAQGYLKPRPADCYFATNNMLGLRLNGDLVSAPKEWADRDDAVLPYLPGADGFYIEYEYAVTSNDRDVFPAVWLMPVEGLSNGPGPSRGDPPRVSRWFEIDVDEAGFGPGACGTIHSWARVDGETLHVMQNTGNCQKSPLDRTVFHRYGCAFDPQTRTVSWWLDDALTHKAVPPDVSPVAVAQNYYLILSAQTHGKNVPYEMVVKRVRAFVPPTSSVRPSPKWKGAKPATCGGRHRIKSAWVLNADGSTVKNDAFFANGYSFDIGFTPKKAKSEVALVVRPDVEYGKECLLHLENEGTNSDGVSLVLLSVGDPGNFWKGTTVATLPWLAKGETKTCKVKVSESEPYLVIRIAAGTNPGVGQHFSGWFTNL